MVITRFAPSPTGRMHLGNVRTALLNWLYARRHEGRFILRFEDTDVARSDSSFVSAIEEDLIWLGLNWDGEARFQSAHADQYRQALADLVDQGLAYRCFCSESTLALERKLASSRGLPSRYNGVCRKLSSEESAERGSHESHVWRLATHGGEGEIHVRDLLRGKVEFGRPNLDDPVIRRSDGSYTFLLPNAVDDMVDGITHVLRGDDHLTNSAYQVFIMQALRHKPPAYLHHGLLLASGGGKLSKRSGSQTLTALRDQGIMPEAVVQAMTRLGHPNLPDEVLPLSTLGRRFDAEHLSPAAVIWSDEELWRWHTRVLHEMPVPRLAPLLRPFVPDGCGHRLDVFTSLVQPNLSLASDARGFVRLIDPGYELPVETMKVIRKAGESFFDVASQTWRVCAEKDWQPWMERLKTETGLKGRKLFLPLRAALTGCLHGPGMRDIVDFLGADGVCLRLEDAIRRLRA